MCTSATKWAKISSICSQITKLHPMFWDFPAKPYPMFRDFFVCKKVTHLSGTPPSTLLGEYPPPPRALGPYSYVRSLADNQPVPQMAINRPTLCNEKSKYYTDLEKSLQHHALRLLKESMIVEFYMIVKQNIHWLYTSIDCRIRRTLWIYCLHVSACRVSSISVARGGGGGGRGAIAPTPIMLFRTFVGTFGNLSVHWEICRYTKSHVS